MPHRIDFVEPHSPADKAGLRVGDRLAAINGEPVLDQVDYQALTALPALTLALETPEGPKAVSLRKRAEQPLGLRLAASLSATPCPCVNGCIFCFVDQMPTGMRPSLYVKDDDWRMSLMMGSYITLTNLDGAAFDRILRRRASPLYISVHATDPTLRARMMGHPDAGEILPQLRRLAEAGLSFHCQVVLCPGWNDGAALDQTLLDLAALAPAARSVALVPVGLTRHRAGLPDLAPFDAPRAAALLERAHGHQARFRAQLGTAFVFAADELYCLSGTPLPSDAAYENYPQLENGVGLLRAFEGEFVRAFEDGTAEGGLRPADAPPRRVTLVTGVSAAPFLRALLARCPIPGLSVDVRAVVNRFFGETVTVAGLLTGQDLRAQLPPLETDALLLPANMLRDDGLFLDDMTLAELERGLGLPIQVVACDGAALLDALAR